MERGWGTLTLASGRGHGSDAGVAFPSAPWLSSRLRADEMLIVDSLIISGVKFVLTRLAEAVEAEMYDESALRDELLAAQMKLELGEITEEDFVRVEEQVLAGMREVRARQKAASGQAPDSDGERAGDGRRFTIESVEANFDHDEDVAD